MTVRWPDRGSFRPMKTKVIEIVTHRTVVDYDAYWRLNWEGMPDPDGSWWFDKEDYPELVDAVLYFKAWAESRRREKEEQAKVAKEKRKAENKARRAEKAERDQRRAQLAEGLVAGFAEHQAKKEAGEATG